MEDRTSNLNQYQIVTSEIDLHTMQFTVVNRQPKAQLTTKKKIEKDLFQVFKKYA